MLSSEESIDEGAVPGRPWRGIAPSNVRVRGAAPLLESTLGNSRRICNWLRLLGLGVLLLLGRAVASSPPPSFDVVGPCVGFGVLRRGLGKRRLGDGVLRQVAPSELEEELDERRDMTAAAKREKALLLFGLVFVAMVGSGGGLEEVFSFFITSC